MLDDAALPGKVQHNAGSYGSITDSRPRTGQSTFHEHA